MYKVHDIFIGYILVSVKIFGVKEYFIPFALSGEKQRDKIWVYCDSRKSSVEWI